jgi:hypothetical protein
VAHNLDEADEHDPETASRDDEKILAEAKVRFALAEDADSENRTNALDDLKFAAGEQWDPQVEAGRKADRRPCFTINRLPQHIKQVTNDQRQNRPSIKVHPVDDKADVETAKIYSGLIRHIEYNSNADTAYDTAFDSAVRGGRGFWRIITDYVSPMSFDQEILIKRVRNPFSVVFDPYSKEPDGSDANFAFISEKISRDEFKAQYPDSKVASDSAFEPVGDTQGWFTDDAVRVAEYFYKDYRSTTICLLSNGQVIEKDKIEEYAASLPVVGMTDDGQEVREDVQIVQERKTRVPVIRWCKITGSEILDKTDWLGNYIPIVPVYGEELDIDGKRILKGIVRDAKDPQRLVNYWKSAEAETIALAPKAPWIAEEGQLAGFEEDWASANTRNHAFLKYKAKSVNGVPLPPPSRQVFEPAVQAITQAAMLAADDLKATTGIHDATLGARGNETSGIAIQRRNVQAQTSNFHFVDNLTRSQRHTGRILIDLLPKVYDTARVGRILGEDGTPEIVKINEEFEQNGKLVTYDLSKGKYDATVDVGPSYASKRQEAAASMLEVVKAVPQLMQIAPDLLVKNMDWPGAQDLSERLKKTIPPNLLDDPKQKQGEVPPQIQAQMQQMGDMIDQLTQKLNTAQDAIEHKRIELESRERIEFKKLEVQLEIERAKLDAKDALALLNAEIASIQERMQYLRADQPIEDVTQDQQDFGPEAAGAMGAEVGAPGFDDPTGGESPGQTMEQSNVDSSAF